MQKNIKNCSCCATGCTGSNYTLSTNYGVPETNINVNYNVFYGTTYTSPVNNYGPTGTNYTFIYGVSGPNPNYGVSGSNYPNYGVSGSNPNYGVSVSNYGMLNSNYPNYGVSGSNNTVTIIPKIESFFLDKYNMYNQKINLDKEVCEYLNIKKHCSIRELKNSLEKISFQNKEYLLSHNIFKNKENIPDKKSVIFLDNEGKKIFNLKSNLIDINCLIDLILFNFMNKVPDCYYYDHNKKAQEICELIL